MDDVPLDASESPAEDVHLWDYVEVVLRRLPVALAVGAAILVFAGIYTFTRHPRYTATSRILIESGEVNLTDIKDAYDPKVTAAAQREFMQTQVKLITSAPVLEAVLQKAGLLSDPEFRKARDPLKRLAMAVSAVPARGTHLVDVSVEREDKLQAARIVNEVVDAFLAQSRQRRLGISEEGLQDLRKMADTLRERLNAATSDLQAFAVTNGIVSFEKEQNVVLEAHKDLSSELTRKEPLRMSLQARVEAARQALSKGQPVDSLPDVMSSQLVGSMRLSLVKLEQDYSQMIERLGTNHPQLQAISTQIDALRTRIAVEADSILQSMETEYEQARREEALLRTRLGEQQAEVFRFNRLASQYNVLKQNKESIENTYQTIIRRIQEIDSLQMGAQGQSVFVISRAAPPAQKSWPSHAKHLAVACLLAAACAVGLCFFLDYMDVTFKGEADVKHALRARVLAGIPDARAESVEGSRTNLVVAELPRSHAAEAFRTLRTSLASIPPRNKPIRTVVVSSAMPSEGKSLVATNLAIAEAQVGRKTLLVDTDMRKPRLGYVFPAPSEKGISDLLADGSRVSVDEAVIPSGIKGLWLLPCGPLPANPVELLDSERFDRLVQELKSRFDFVVFDSPPGLSLVDSVIIGRYTDGLLVVVRSYATAKAPVQHFVDAVRSANVRVLGVAVNNVDYPRTGHYGYGPYLYYGGKRHGSYYRHASENEPPLTPNPAQEDRLSAKSRLVRLWSRFRRA